MSSLLALRPGVADLSSSNHYQGSSHCRGAEQGMLHRGSYSGRGSFGFGLPTPPATTDMTTISSSNGGAPYSQQYSYVPEQRHHATASHEGQPKLYAPRDKLTAGPYERKVQSGVGMPTTNGVTAEDQIASHLQIPESVNSSKGSLAEFAAEITCLFWFETSETLEYAECLPEGAMINRGLHADAIPTIGFRKWVTTILSTTQVGKNVILLALMFIYRLKKFNPSVSGKRGSEFRLLTIALMLGNKFLDDNTYTNKTWAEVSGISVNEIHIMEVEFLSNMRYELYASHAQWQDWKGKLRRFGSFYEKASKFNGSPKAISPRTPVTQGVPHKLPSPPSDSRPNGSYGSHGSLPNPLHTLPQLPRSPAKQYPDYTFERKRSLDMHLEMPPAKRIQSSLASASSLSSAAHTPQSVYTPSSSSTAASFDVARLPQLPMPNLPNAVSRNGPQLTPLSLPGPRAMSTVYPATTGYSQPVTPVISGPPNLAHVPSLHPTAPGPTARAPSHAGSAHTSPTHVYGASTPTRPGLSPSYFLMNRSSPYRPVRHVNTLLYPPPSTAMQNPTKNIDYQQMHYQPLSKHTSQLRSGPMPCSQPDAWQSHVTTPIHQAYRPY